MSSLGAWHRTAVAVVVHPWSYFASLELSPGETGAVRFALKGTLVWALLKWAESAVRNFLLPMLSGRPTGASNLVLPGVSPDQLLAAGVVGLLLSHLLVSVLTVFVGGGIVALVSTLLLRPFADEASTDQVAAVLAVALVTIALFEWLPVVGRVAYLHAAGVTVVGLRSVYDLDYARALVGAAPMVGVALYMVTSIVV
jgi:hypothetical protein